MVIESAFKNVYKKISQYLEVVGLNLGKFFSENLYLLIVLFIVSIMVYGFELFNFNLSIDEELHATYSGPTLSWIQQGRWGMYLLNKFLLPYTVIPIVPLFLTLIFQIISILLLVNTWGNYSKLEKVIIGSICLAYPGLAYAYSFSTLNYGIGFGFFCSALSLWLFTKNRNLKSFLAIIPATFAVSIYQGMIPALVAIYLIYYINLLLSQGDAKLLNLAKYVLVVLGAIVLSQIIQAIFLRVYGLTPSAYGALNFDFQSIKQNLSTYYKNFVSIIENVYLGDKSIYAIELRVLAIILAFSLIGFVARLYNSKSLMIYKLFSVSLVIAMLVLPFLGGFFMNGFYAMRFLVAVSIIIAGIIAIGININSSIYKFIIIIITIFGISQFAQSANHLFAASNISLIDDRLLGERLIEQIDNAVYDTGNPESVKYLEVIGYYQRPSTTLKPENETIGASFFEWEQGNAARVILFLKTLGYSGLEVLPAVRRPSLVELANTMPSWPRKGSVIVVNDTVLIKFGPYSYAQRNQICSILQKQSVSNFDMNTCMSTLFPQ